MSGFHPFGLSALGSMSTLGNLTQSAQRLDRLNDLMSSRNQGSNWSRDKPRRSMDDDFFGGGGGMMGGGSSRNRRSLTPPRHFDRDDRRSNQRRDRGNQRRMRGNDSYGSSGGAGILGAAPGLNDMSGSSLSGLGDLGGFGGGGGSLGDRAGNSVSQLNAQAQQLLSMMQTQQLLAAVQAQANLANANPGPPSLMQSSPNQGFSRAGGRNMNQRNNQGRNARNDRSRYGGQRMRDDRKRKSSPPRNPLPKRDRRENTSQPTRSDKKDQDNKRTASQKNKEESSKKESNKESKVTKDVQEQEKKKEDHEEGKIAGKNAAGEEIEALVKENFDGKRYWCALCKIVCLKSKNIYKHYVSKRHVKAAIEKQGKVFDPEIMKEKPKEEDVTSFLKYVCNSRKIARKEIKDVIISSQHECIVRITDFTTKQNFMGSEFVKAISGFKCQLCKAFVRSGRDVNQHVQGKRHRTNYEAYLRDHPGYLETQLQVNKNLVEILEKQEGEDVLLFEVKNNEAVDGAQPAEEPEKNCNLQENLDEDEVASYNMDDYDPADDSKVDDDSKIADKSTAEEDSLVEESGPSDAAQKSEEISEEELEKSLLNEGTVEQEHEEMDEEEKEQEDNEEQLLMTPTEEKIPFLETVSAKIPEEVKGKEAEVETKEEAEQEEEEKDEKEEMKTPATPSDTSFKEDVDDESPVSTPGRRNTRRSRGRGRGGITRATRGKAAKKTTRSTRNTKKMEEVVENVEEPPKETIEEPPVETNDEPPMETNEKSPETTTEELPKETNEDISFIDGFEVIDEIVGGEDDEDEY